MTSAPERLATTRWGVAGPGGIAERFAEAVGQTPGGTIVAVASRSGDRATAFAGRHGIARSYGSYTALAEDPEVDAVYVAVPHTLHEPLAIDYLDAGKHVLCEKPLAVNAWQAARMVAVARERRVFLMEGLWSRFLPAYRILSDLVGEGRVGRPLLVESDFGYRMPVMAEHRLFDRTLAGGATLDVGIYPLQLATYLLGPPERVSATGAIGATGVDEVVAFTSRHRDGAVASGKAAIRVGLACTARISGEDGWIGLQSPMHDPRRLRVVTPAGREDIDAGYDGDGLRFEVHEVHRCLRAGLTESPVVPLGESLVLARALDDVRAQVGVTYPGEYD